MGRIKRFFWKAPSKDTDFGNSVQSILGFPPKDTQLYERVFTHRSIDKIDDKGVRINYERLEFLGDSVLSTVVSSYLFENLPVLFKSLFVAESKLLLKVREEQILR